MMPRLQFPRAFITNLMPVSYAPSSDHFRPKAAATPSHSSYKRFAANLQFLPTITKTLPIGSLSSANNSGLGGGRNCKAAKLLAEQVSLFHGITNAIVCEDCQ